VKRISDEDLKTWCIRAYEVLIRQTDRPGAMAFRRVLISIKAPFYSENPILQRLGCTFTELFDSLSKGVWPEPKPMLQAVVPERVLRSGAVVNETIDPNDGANAWEALKKSASLRKQAQSNMMFRRIDLLDETPIGVVCCGDMHVGSVGVDYDRLEWVLSLMEGPLPIYAISIGDILDSMIWRTVMHEGRKSPVDFPGEVRAAGEFLGRMYKTGRLIGVCAGNHDLISGKLTGLSALDSIMEKFCEHVPYHPYELNLTVGLHGVDYQFCLRHKVIGNSGWNPAHGVGKAHRFDHRDSDVIVAGHTHRSGISETVVKGRTRYGVQVGAYKIHELDDYAIENGFTFENLHPDYMVLLWPKRFQIQVVATKTGVEILRSLAPSSRSFNGSLRKNATSNGKARSATASASTTDRQGSSSPKGTGRRPNGSRSPKTAK